MNIQITEDNFELSESEKKYIFEKFNNVERFLKKFSSDIKNVSVKVWIPNRYEYGVNFQLWLPGGEQVFAEEVSDTLQNAVNEVKEEVERQIKRRKEDYKN